MGQINIRIIIIGIIRAIIKKPILECRIHRTTIPHC